MVSLKDVIRFACLPTGYGKSLIYQLAAWVAAELSVVYNYKDIFSTEPVVLVVSPLNALIKDQLSSCEKLVINATKSGRLRVVILRNCLRKPRNLNWKHANSCKCTMGLTSLHYMFMTFLYICCSLFGHSTFSVTSLMFIKGTSCCVIRRNLKWYWAVTMHIVL